MATRSRTVSAVPEDIVRTVYTLGFQHGALTLHDRLRGLAVCRAWQAALEDLPIPLVKIPDGQLGLQFCRWAMLAQPRVSELHQSSNLDLAVHAVQALQHKALTKLVSKSEAIGIDRVLPLPAAFPNLQRLEVGPPVGADWLAGLGALNKLAKLEVNLQPDVQQPDAAVQLPPLPRLTYLKLYIQPQALVHLQLAQLPALAELGLFGSGGRAALLISGPAPQVQGLSCSLEQLWVDISALPGLKRACLAATMELDQATSIAAATALTSVVLQRWEPGGEYGSALDMLENLPPAVKCLELMGTWPAAAAELVGELQGLAALYLDCSEGEEAPVPPAGAPLWTSLRSLSWDSALNETALPQGLRHASKLKALQAWLGNPSARDLNLITSLPTLCKVCIPTWILDWDDDDDEFSGSAQRAAAICVIRRAMPQVEVVHIDRPLSFDKFVVWALK